MIIEEFLSTEFFKTRKQLSNETGYSDRVIRDKISNLKLVKPVIYNSQTSGYRLAKRLEKLTVEEVFDEMKEINHVLTDIRARIDVFNKQQRTYIAYLEKGKEFLQKITLDDIK